jgi:hypothetical protein
MPKRVGVEMKHIFKNPLLPRASVVLFTNKYRYAYAYTLQMQNHNTGTENNFYLYNSAVLS